MVKIESLKEDSTGSSSSAIVDLTGPTLPALKLILERGFSKANIVGSDYNRGSILGNLVDRFMRQILLNIHDSFGKLDSTRARVWHKLGNNLLAWVLVLTCLPSEVPISRAGLDEYCLVLCKLILNDVSEVSVFFFFFSPILSYLFFEGMTDDVWVECYDCCCDCFDRLEQQQQRYIVRNC